MMKDKIAFTDNLIPPGNFDHMLSRFISFLTTGNPDASILLKKGGICLLSADDLRQERRATLQWLLTPAIMVKLPE